MSSPVLPSHFQEVIPDSTSSKCAAFVKSLLQLPVLVWKFISWMIDADGNLQPAFKKLIQPTGTFELSGYELTLDGSRLLCDGSDVSRETYADLFDAIGTTFGDGDASTTFTLPDFRDRFPIGVSATKTVGMTGGAATVELIEANLPAHHHMLFTDTNQGSVGPSTTLGVDSYVARQSTDPGGDGEYSLCDDVGNPSKVATVGKSSDVGSADDDEALAHPNMPPWLAIYVYIRT